MTPQDLAGRFASRDVAALDAAAAALPPGSPWAAALRAEALRRGGREAEALPLFDAALAALPDVLPLLHAAALADVATGRHDRACLRWEAFVARAPQVAGAWLNLGLARARLGRDDALAALDRAAALAPADPRPLARAAALLGERADLPAALARLDEAIARAPQDASLHFARAAHRSSLAQHAGAIADLRRATDLAPGDAAGRSALLVELHYDATLAPDALALEHRAWATRHAATPAALPAPRTSRRPRLRIGYLSPRFGDAPLAALLLPVLEAHDRGCFETVAYATGPATATADARIRGAVDRWVDLPADDDAAARLLAGDDPDVLVDLAGHAPGNRLPLLARRPARRQATWLDWFDTTGVPAIDWLVADRWHAPPGEDDRYTEHVLRLPDARFVYRAPVPVAATPAPVLRNGHVTFGSFNRHAKLGDEVIATWSRILHAVPRSRLLLRASAYRAQDTVAFVRARWRAAGVPVERIDFAPYTGLAALHAAYAGVDVALDPFPFAGGVTTCDALAHGVPVVTLQGDRMVARQGVALLHAAGHPEWIASTPDDYVAHAVALADAARLPALRAALARDVAHSPLMDVPRFTRALERAFAAMAGSGDR